MSPLIRLNPTAPATTPSFKTQTALYVSVQDTRPKETLGELPARANEKPVQAKAVVPVEEVVRLHVSEALRKAGFQIISTPTGTSPQLVLQIKRLDFKIDKSGLSSEIKGAGELSVTGMAGGATRSKSYTAETGKTWAFGPPPNGHEQYLNEILTDLLNAFLTDEKFLSFLAAS